MICGSTAVNDLVDTNNNKVKCDDDIKNNEEPMENSKYIPTLGKQQKCLFTVNPATTSAPPSASSSSLEPLSNSLFSQTIKTFFNARAPPFTLNQSLKNTVPLLKDLQLQPPKILSTKPLSVDARIWRSISARPKTNTTQNEIVLNRTVSGQNLSYSQQYGSPFLPSIRRSNCDLELNTKLFGPIVLPNGTIQIRLREGIRVDMTLDKAVRVVNNKSGISISLANTTFSAALTHPNGKVYQYGSRVEIVAYDGMQTNHYVRYAKMWYKGISFTSENCALIYLVDSAGTRTTTESISDMSNDYTIAVFLNDSYHGGIYTEEAITVVQNSNYWYTEDGTEVYDINGFRISQTPDGLVKVTQSHNKCLIRTSPGNGSATLTTPYLHCTASLGQTSHLFVRRGERRMHFDGSSFVVRNAGHSAGFDDNNLLKVY